jgi:hypothetical protein
MAEQVKSIDVGDSPEILRLVEEVRRGGEPRVLRKGGEELATIVPLSKTSSVQFKKPTEADVEAFRNAAGSWSDIDTDALIERIYSAREEGTRPADRP